MLETPKVTGFNLKCLEIEYFRSNSLLFATFVISRSLNFNETITTFYGVLNFKLLLNLVHGRKIIFPRTLDVNKRTSLSFGQNDATF